MAVGHYENFPVASLLLPAPLREPVEVIYRFARSADDFADEGNDPPEMRLKKLNDYRAQLAAPSTPLFRDLEKIIREHGLPVQLLADLLDAFSQDVTRKRYQNYPEVLDYCRRSANPVGRLLLHLFKRTSDLELRQSDAICTALQLVNHWQDVAVDWAQGRVYIPQEDLRRFHVEERDIPAANADDRWARLMAFQCQRARDMLLEGAPLGRALPGRLGLEIRATVQGGLAILDKIDAVKGDVFRRRPKLTKGDWVKILVKAL